MLNQRTRARLRRHGPIAVIALAFTAWLWHAHGPVLAALTLAATLVTWAIIPPLGRFLRRHRIVVRSGGRSAHKGSVPPMGGLAVYIPFAVVALVLVANGGTRMLGLLTGATLLLAVGLFDDVKGTSPRIKVLAQILGGLVLVATGFRLEVLGIPGLGTFELGSAAIPVTIFWVVLATNAFNLIDGMDGIAAGVAVITLAALAYLGVAAPLAAIVVGSLLGFLPHNLPRARIFLGDSGTMFLGFLLAALLLDLPPQANLPLVVGLFAYPLADLSLAVLRRFVRGKPLFRGDRSHIHHKLRVHLANDRRVVLLVWTLAVAVAALALLMRDFEFLLLAVVLWAVMAIALVALGRVRLQRMIGNRRPFQELHLLRQYVEGRIRFSETRDRVRDALERLATDLGLAVIRVGGLTVLNGDHDDPRLEWETVRFRRGRAQWASLPNGPEEEALANERRTVVHGVLLQADRRLRQLDARNAATKR